MKLPLILCACRLYRDQSDLKSLPLDVLDRVSVVIDTVLNYTDNPPLVSNRILLQAVQESSKRTQTKRRYIYTRCLQNRARLCARLSLILSRCCDISTRSGGLVYGDYGNELIDETFQPKAPMPRVAWEREVLAVKDVDTVVIRPGLYVCLSHHVHHFTGTARTCTYHVKVINVTECMEAQATSIWPICGKAMLKVTSR